MIIGRRQLLRGCLAIPLLRVGATAAASEPRSSDEPALHDLVMELHDSLSTRQRDMLCLPAKDHRRHKGMQSDWFVRPDNIGRALRPAQRELALDVFRELHSPEYGSEVERQVAEDNHAPGVEGVSLAFFGEPDASEGLGLVFAGRHVTRRWEAQSSDPFSGTVFCGHASGTFNETPDHPGNVYWYQALAANRLLRTLNGPDRERALAGRASLDVPECLKRPRTRRGLSFARLDAERLELARALVHAIVVRPFRPSHAQRALAAIEARGGIERFHMHFFAEEDLGQDGVYDNFEVWGPGFHCNFRGAPHSHCWLKVRGA